MTNVIDFQSKRDERNKKNIQFIPVEVTFDVVYDIDYDKFFKMFTTEEPQ